MKTSNQKIVSKNEGGLNMVNNKNNAFESTKKNMVNINIAIPEELHKKLKLASIMQDGTLKDFIIKTLEEYSK